MAWDDNLPRSSIAYAIAASTSNRLRILAGPGTGKSFAMKRRVARLLEQGLAPDQILAVTFTRVAADDLHRELTSLNVIGCDELEGRTLHSLGLSILRRNHVLESTGRMPRPLNQFEIEPLICDLPAAHGGKRDKRARQKLFEAAWARLQHEEPGYAPTPSDQRFEADLIEWLRFHEGMLVGEIMPILYRYLRDNPAAVEHREFDHVLVDEFQDLNKAEQLIVAFLGNNGSICIVGDDDQSIYSFKHAHPDGIRSWLNEHPSAQDLSINECRRCPTRVVEMANALVAHNTNRQGRYLDPLLQNGNGVVELRQFSTLQDEAEGITRRIQALIRGGINPGDILVLAQRRAIANPIFQALRQAGIPTKSYYEETELDSEYAQERLALLKLLVNRDDRIALRWLLGSGHTNFRSSEYARIRADCEASGRTPWETLSALEAGTLRIPHTSRLIERFREIVSEVAHLDANDQLDALVDAWLPQQLAGDSLLRELALSMLAESEDRTGLLKNIVTATTQPEVPMELSDVRVMSLHKSKGLSAPVVFVAGCVEGLLPSAPPPGASATDQAAHIEEQRRLFYVAITRTKANPQQNQPGTLILTYSQTISTAVALGAGIQPAYNRHGTAYVHASRFIAEMGPDTPAPIAG